MRAPSETLTVKSMLMPSGTGRDTTVWVVSVKSVNFTSSSSRLSVERGESSSM